MFIIRAETHKMHIRIANEEDPGLQAQSDWGLSGSLVVKVLEHYHTLQKKQNNSSTGFQK